MRPEAPRLFRFPNGFEFLFVPDRHAPVVALDLWVRVGSASERANEAGMAHLVEHMLFKGTARRGPGDMAAEIEGVGGEINAYTSFDHTVYTAVVASRFVELGLDILSDAAFHAAFDPEELAREKGVVLEEIKRGRDLPQQYLSRLLFQSVYTAHPYGKPVIGDADTVSSFSADGCREFVARWYRPGNMTLVAVGDARAEHLADRVGERFGTKGAKGRPRGPRRAREPARRRFEARFEGRDVHETYFNLAFPAPGAAHPDVPALDLLTTVLGQGEASRLQHRVKLDRNLVRTVGMGAYTPRDPGLLHVGAVAEPARFADAYAAICEELFRLGREGVGDTELERARRNVEADFVYQRETVQGQAQKAGFFHVVLGDVAAEDRYLDALRRVTAGDLVRVARRLLRPDRAVLVALHPSEEPPPWDPVGAGHATQLAETHARSVSRPVRGRRRRAADRWDLPCGARVLVKVNPHVPVVALRVALPGGLRREPAGKAGAFHLLADCLTRGTKRRSVFELAERIDGISGSVEGFSGRNSYGLHGEFLSRHLEEGLELFGEALCHPSFPEDEVAKAREDTLGSLRLREDHPASRAFRAFEALLYADHPYGRDLLGTPLSVPTLTAEDLETLHRAALRPARMSIGVAGAVDPDRVCALLEGALAGVSPRGDLSAPPSPPSPPSHPLETRIETPGEQSHVIVGFSGARLDDVDRYALRVASGVLSGQGGRLFRRLRDELGLAYSVTSTTVEGLDPGYLAGYIATDPSRAREAREGLLEEIIRLGRDPVARAELDRARRRIVGSFEIALQENAVQATQMALDDLYGLDGRSLDQFVRGIMAVTPETLLDAARRYLDPDRHAAVVLGPR